MTGKSPAASDLNPRAADDTQPFSPLWVHFFSHPVRMPPLTPLPNGVRTVEVLRTEEKGSDVNLATYLLVDVFEGEYEVAVVVSNDSDLVEPIRIVRSKLGIPVAVLNPQKDPLKTSCALVNSASLYRRIRMGALAASQFPPTLTDSTGSFRKPSEWKR